MTSLELLGELTPTVLLLILRGQFVDAAAVKEANQTLAETYDQAQSVLPTYLGAGRSADGLGLHRHRGGGAYSPSFENAALAIACGRRLGWSDQEIAGAVGYDTFAELMAEVDKLPAHADTKPPTGPTQPAAPKAPKAPKPPAGPTPAALLRQQRQEEAEEAKRQQQQEFEEGKRRRDEEERNRPPLTPEEQAVYDQLSTDD